MKISNSEVLLLRHAVEQRVTALEMESRRKAPVLDRGSADFGKTPGLERLEAYRALAATLEGESVVRYRARRSGGFAVLPGRRPRRGQVSATISQDLLGTIRSEVDLARSEIAKRHGLTMRLAKITDAETSFSAKVEGTLDGGSREADTFKALAHLYGLRAEHLGRR